MVRILLPIRKGSGKEQGQEPQRKGKDTVSFVFCSEIEINCLSPDKPPFDLPLGRRRDKQLAALHLLLKSKVKSTPNQLLMGISLAIEPPQ